MTQFLFDKDNPYAIVRKEEWRKECDGILTVHTKSYDAKNRVVGISTVKYQDGRQIGHFAESVGSDGYWWGGAYDERVETGFQTCHPFIEGEVQ